MRRLLTIMVLFLTTVVSAQTADTTVVAISPSHWFIGAGFRTYFKNDEFSGNSFGESGTLFGVRLSPYIGLQFRQNHRLVFGVNMRQDFGAKVSFVSDIKPMIYYRFSNGYWTAAAGCYPRSIISRNYGDLLVDPCLDFREATMGGMIAHYEGRRGMFEVLINWDGMFSKERREKFTILSTGEYRWSWFNTGYTFNLTHLALSANENPDEGVVENIMIAPYAGIRFNAFFDFDIRAQLVASMQRDRHVSMSATYPVGTQINVGISKWGAFLRNNLYAGKSQMPFWNKYGPLMYNGFHMYATDRNIYNETIAGYGHSVWNGAMNVEGRIAVAYDGTGVGTYQTINLSINLEKLFKFK